MAERGSPQWKMNIGKANSHLVEPEQTLCCPYCKGEGWIQNPGWELRLRREQAGLTQKEFVKQLCKHFPKYITKHKKYCHVEFIPYYGQIDQNLK